MAPARWHEDQIPRIQGSANRSRAFEQGKPLQVRCEALVLLAIFARKVVDRKQHPLHVTDDLREPSMGSASVDVQRASGAGRAEIEPTKVRTEPIGQPLQPFVTEKRIVE